MSSPLNSAIIKHTRESAPTTHESASTPVESPIFKFKRSPPDSPSFDSMAAAGGPALSLFQAAAQNSASPAASMQQLSKSSPFLLPAQFYKNLFASAAMLQQQNKSSDKLNTGQPPFPRNLLFSCAQRSPTGGGTGGGDCEAADEKSDSIDQVKRK